MAGRKLLTIGTIGLLLGMLFVLQLPQIHNHPSTPVEPSQCPMVLVHSNSTGLAVTPAIILPSPFTFSEPVPSDLPQLAVHPFLPSSRLLRAPPVA